MPDPDTLLSTPKAARYFGISPYFIEQNYEPVTVSKKGRRYYTVASIREQMAQRRTAGDAA